MSAPRVTIHYRRLPDRWSVFEQWKLADTGECVVTFNEATPLPRPVTVAGHPVLEPGAPSLWFSYPGRWYDIGSFHLADGTFTGLYANVLTPVRMARDRWETTDLCLDVWAGADGRVEMLDEEEFHEAVERGWMDEPTAAAARAEAERLARAARAGEWPPAPVAEWGLERARERLRELRGE